MTAEQAAILYNGLIVFAGGLLVWLGTNFSKKKANDPSAGETMEIAGAVINSKDARGLIESFDNAASHMSRLTDEIAEHRRILERNTAAAKDVCEATDHVNQEMRNLANALLMQRH